MIVLHAPEQKMFEEAIFILKDSVVGQEGITDDALLKEAKRLLWETKGRKKSRYYLCGPIWACGGAILMGIVWVLTVLF